MAAEFTADEALSTAFELSSTPLAIVGLDGIWQRVNTALAILLRAQPEQLCGSHELDHVPPTERNAAENWITALATGATTQLEARRVLLRPDGTLVDVRATARVTAVGTGGAVWVTRFDKLEVGFDQGRNRELDEGIAALLNHTETMMFIKDGNFVYQMVNEAYARSCGRSPADMIGRTDYDLWPERTADQYRRNDLDILTTGEPQLREAPLADRVRGDRVYLTWKLPMRHANGEIWGIGAVSSDVTLQVEARKVLAAVRDEEAVKARTDSLTGLPNRLALTEFLTERLEHEDVAVLFCDMNGFKEVNDVYGHAAGDAVLVETGERLRQVIRREDRMGRWGGDEFVVILPMAATDVAGELADRIRQAIAEPYRCDGDPRQLGVSIGVALAPRGSDSDAVLKRADTQMYVEKVGSRTR